MPISSDERTSLLSHDGNETNSPSSRNHNQQGDQEDAREATSSADQNQAIESSRERAAIIAILLLGVFVANADGTLVIAQTGSISSEFGNLGGSEWLISVYFLSTCAAQPIVGKLSDIYGRKKLLLWSYALFIVGNFLTGFSSRVWELLVGRGFAGLGGAGMLSLVSILIADIVPIRTVAAWRSYVNVAATIGRSVGGPIGGALADTIGWRWSFYAQCPLTFVAFLLVLWRLPGPRNYNIITADANENRNKRRFDRLRRIDFVGAITVIIATVSFLLALELGSTTGVWVTLETILLFVASLGFAGVFFVTEQRWAKEPIFPVRLMRHRDVITTYPVVLLQSIAQMGLMYAVPLYFQITKDASTLEAGTRLVPAVVGNAVGGLLCGFMIHRTGRYKLLTLFGLAFACLGYAVIVFTWHGQTDWAATLLIFPGGFGMGVAMSTTFIALTAGAASADLAIVGAGLYEAHGIGAALGSCITMSVLQAALRPMLAQALGHIGVSEEVVRRSIEDISYVRSLKGSLHGIVVKCYVRSLMWTHVASLSFSFLAFVITLFWTEHKL